MACAHLRSALPHPPHPAELPRFADVELRLANATLSGSSIAGRLEWMHQGQWYAIASNPGETPSSLFASGVCQSMGHATGYPLPYGESGRGDLNLTTFNQFAPSYQNYYYYNKLDRGIYRFFSAYLKPDSADYSSTKAMAVACTNSTSE